jgi:hypothetical protein
MSKRGGYLGGSTIIGAGISQDIDRILDAEAKAALRQRPIASAPVQGERERDEQRLQEIKQRQEAREAELRKRAGQPGRRRHRRGKRSRLARNNPLSRK